VEKLWKSEFEKIPMWVMWKNGNRYAQKAKREVYLGYAHYTHYAQDI